MGTQLVRRLIYSVLLMIASLTLIFFLIDVIPGSPFDAMRKEMADRNMMSYLRIPTSHWDRLNRILNLETPVGERYVLWITGVFSGDLSESWSISTGSSVMKVLLTRLPYTLLLMFTTTTLSLLIAVPVGIYSAVRPYSTVDLYTTMFAFLGMAMPTFWVGALLVSIFSSGLDWLPYNGVADHQFINQGDIIDVFGRILSFGALNPQLAGHEGPIFVDGLKHLLLPTITASLVMTARLMRFVRSAIREVLSQDYIRTAFAKGLPSWKILIKHALPNGLISLITVLSLEIPILFTGAFLTEVVFSWPGVGRLYVDSVQRHDWPVLMGVLVFYVFLRIFANFAADTAYVIADPRIKSAL